MRSTMVNLWHPVKRVQISDLGRKEILVSIFPQNGYGSARIGLKGNASKIQGQSDMEHNSEECAIVGGDGKKRPRRDSGNCSKGNVPRSLVVREERLMG
ncbi:hypothetical protein Goarm_013157 [Gossypium armourianum]|uniref:Uncharacterized protein n=1 Tax=Gossypium armourianum TaxID=34283 RepID=A0A7J9J4Y1_9ROSI|nr:hypothetical protein [Gossypium armourianum]